MSASLVEALHTLVAGPYGREVRIGQSLEEAERAVSGVVLWHLRVLAGWQPQAGAEMVRVLAGWFEVANVVDAIREDSSPPYRLGALAVAWPRLQAAATREERRRVLAASPWGDPGASSPSAITVGMQLGWAARVAARVPQARAWAAGAAALLVAREWFQQQRRLPETVVRRAEVLLGSEWTDASTLEVFTSRVSGEARWPLEGVRDPGELWRAEARWWRRVEQDAWVLVRRPGFGPDPVVGCVALLGVDAWRVQAALEMAARGGGPVEVFDAVA